jgi:hypothetical protein
MWLIYRWWSFWPTYFSKKMAGSKLNFTFSVWVWLTSLALCFLLFSRLTARGFIFLIWTRLLAIFSAG